MAFLISELHAAESAGQAAYIIGHASPAVSLPAQSHYLNQIMQRYRHTIAGQFYGHTHHSEIGIGYLENGHKSSSSATTVAYTAGSVTPFGGTVNPTFRVFEVDEASGEVWDWTDYYANISDPVFQAAPNWQPLYSIRNAYASVTQLEHSEPLSPAFWHKVTEALALSQHLFRRYIYFRLGGSRFGAFRACRTEACWNYTICAMRRARKEDRCDGTYARNATIHQHSQLPPADEAGDMIDMLWTNVTDHQVQEGFNGFQDVLAELRRRAELGQDLRHLAR